MNFDNKKMQFAIGLLLFFVTVFGIFQKIIPVNNVARSIASNDCGPVKMQEILELASSAQKTVAINCNVNLKKSDVITKQIVFSGADASELVFDCNNATLKPNEFSTKVDDRISVRSKKTKDGKWIRPENIIIRNCDVFGSVRVSGMAPTGEGEYLRESSRQDKDHTLRAQNNAPKNITFTKIKITGLGARTPLYISPGVTYLTLQNSIMTGKSPGVAIYFDAESAYNTIKNNIINTDTEDKHVINVFGIKLMEKSREIFAVDGSAYNTIIGNKFSNLNHGGIYLYRNCGEGGTIRHQSPHHNHIINNIFYYKQYSGSNPSIFLGSRNGDRNYCDIDKGYDWGSSIDDSDFAVNNVIADNQIVENNPRAMIKSTSSSNVVYQNINVTETTDKASGCYLEAQDKFLKSGDVELIINEKSCKNIKCNDGIEEEEVTTCPTKVSCPLNIPKEGSCKFDVGTYKDGQRGTVTGDYQYDEFCRFSVRVKSLYANSGLVFGNIAEVAGSDNYNYTAKINNSGLVVRSSAGQKVCELDFK